MTVIIIVIDFMINTITFIVIITKYFIVIITKNIIIIIIIITKNFIITVAIIIITKVQFNFSKDFHFILKVS